MDCSMSGLPVLHYLPEFAQIHVHWDNDAIQPSHLLSHPSSALSHSQHQGLFKCVVVSISPSNKYSALISFRIDWFDLLAVQGTLKSLLQHYNSKATILWCSAFGMVQLSHPYTTTGKTIAVTIQTFVRPLMSIYVYMMYSESYGFPVVMYECKSWTIKKAECRRINAFKLCCWRRLLRVPWTPRRSS